jgi:hypothetical protein
MRVVGSRGPWLKKEKISELQTKFSERDAGGHGRHGVRQAYNCCASCDEFARGAF